MGQAKARGTYEQRKAAPLGPKSNHDQWERPTRQLRRALGPIMTDQQRSAMARERAAKRDAMEKKNG
jgi:hypothetical protein